ncbi:MAG: M48 family metalloprotease [Legionellales bacterium]|jgi:predicted Zn-dependent protease
MNRLKTIFHYIVLQSFLLLTLAPSQALAIELPEMGDSSGRSLSHAQAKELGDQIMLQVRQSPLYNTDAIVTSYVQALGARLVPEKEEAEFYFFVINDPRVNAFALPGGYIGINAGLILVAEHEDEVAGVMAHEIAHVTQRHIARMFERSQSLTWPMIAALLGSVILTAANPALGSGALATVMASGQQDMINFTRSNEEEADRVGMEMLAEADYDPMAMSTFFGRMAQANKYNESFYVPDFLRTHPVNSARVADAATRAQQYPPVKKTESLSFRLIKQRLYVMYAGHNQDIIAHYRAELEKPGNNQDPALRYGYSLALAKKGSLSLSITELLQLLNDKPNEKIYLMSLAEVYQEQHAYMKGIALLQNAMRLYPRDEAISLQLVKMLINAEQYRQAKTLMDSQIRYADDHPLYYHYLAQAQSELGNPQASHMARANYYAMQDDPSSAIRELKRAQAYDKDNDYIQAKISAQLKKVEKELELKLEKMDM